MPAWEYRPDLSFRGWLWTVLVNKWRDRVRHLKAGPRQAAPTALENVASPSNVDQFAEDEYRAYLAARALQLMKDELARDDWLACQEYLVRGRAAADVARELNITVNQVYLAKSRVLRRLREELEGLLD
jgi:RNA polymerase sigma-70 factor (ECF subfamily)